MQNKQFNRKFEEVEGGKYDKFGFYRTPNGSFWDCDGVYFNKEGKDAHGGFYDENYEYHPGDGWIESLMCYEDEVDPNFQPNDQQHDDYEDGDYDVYEDYREDLKYGNYRGPSYYDVVGSKHNQQQHNTKYDKGQVSEKPKPIPQPLIEKPADNQSGKEKIFKPIILKEEPSTQQTNQNTKVTSSSINPVQEKKVNTAPQVSSEPKNKIELSSAQDNSKVQQAIKTNKEVSIEGFKVSDNLLDSDDDEKPQFKGQKGKR